MEIVVDEPVAVTTTTTSSTTTTVAQKKNKQANGTDIIKKIISMLTPFYEKEPFRGIIEKKIYVVLRTRFPSIMSQKEIIDSIYNDSGSGDESHNQMLGAQFVAKLHEIMKIQIGYFEKNNYIVAKTNQTMGSNSEKVFDIDLLIKSSKNVNSVSNIRYYIMLMIGTIFTELPAEIADTSGLPKFDHAINL